MVEDADEGDGVLGSGREVGALSGAGENGDVGRVFEERGGLVALFGRGFDEVDMVGITGEEGAEATVATAEIGEGGKMMVGEEATKGDDLGAVFIVSALPIAEVGKLGVVVMGSHDVVIYYCMKGPGLFEIGEELGDGFSPRPALFQGRRSVFGHNFLRRIQADVDVVFFEGAGDGVDGLRIIVKADDLVAVDAIAPAVVGVGGDFFAEVGFLLGDGD